MNDLAHHWQLDPGVTFLNHGSFGACPKVILARQQELREWIEREPVAFFMRELEAQIDRSRLDLGGFVGAAPEDLVFVANATEAVNTVLRSLSFQPGDELLTTDHVYNACRNVLQFVAARDRAALVVVPVPFPVAGPDQVVEHVLAGITARTRFALIDHITSPTGLVLPVERLAAEFRERGIDCMIDGAHAPGMVDLDLERLGATYYTGNCHKWLCAPKGAGFLHVRRDRQPGIRPLTLSHGANSQRTDRSRFLLEFDWPGTRDPTAWLCVPDAIRFVTGLFDGGFAELRRHNHELVLAGRSALCAALSVEPPAPDEMIGNLVSLPLPDGRGTGNGNPMGIDPLQDALFHEERIEVPVMPWPRPPKRLLRISAQAYNHEGQYRRLAAAVARRVGS